MFIFQKRPAIFSYHKSNMLKAIFSLDFLITCKCDLICSNNYLHSYFVYLFSVPIYYLCVLFLLWLCMCVGEECDCGWSFWSLVRMENLQSSDGGSVGSCQCRTRACDSPALQCGGQPCQGISVEVANCSRYTTSHKSLKHTDSYTFYL